MPRLPAAQTLEQSVGRLEGKLDSVIETLDTMTETLKAMQEKQGNLEGRVASVERSITFVKTIGSSFIAIAVAVAGWFAPGLANLYMSAHK